MPSGTPFPARCCRRSDQSLEQQVCEKRIGECERALAEKRALIDETNARLAIFEANLEEKKKELETIIEETAAQEEKLQAEKEELQKNNVDAMGEMLHQNWMLKKSLASGISNPLIDDTYDKAMKAGALGGKLLGAGGAGFMIFYVRPEDQLSVRSALSHLREMDFEMDNSGASIVHVDKENI